MQQQLGSLHTMERSERVSGKRKLEDKLKSDGAVPAELLFSFVVTC